MKLGASFLAIAAASVAVFATLLSCEPESENDNSLADIDEYDLVALDIRDFSFAEKMFMGRDGEYIVMNTDADRGPVFMHFNTLDRTLLDGITVMMDKDLLPQSALFDGYSIFFDNLSEDAIDFVIKDSEGNQYCYWDMPLEDDAAIQTKSLIGSPEADAKYLLTLRCMSLSLNTLLTVYGAKTVMNLAEKLVFSRLPEKLFKEIIESSSVKEARFEEYLAEMGERSLAFRSGDNPVLISGTAALDILDDWIQEQYDNLAQEKIFDEDEEFRDYYVKLSPGDGYSHAKSDYIEINCGPHEGFYYVDIDTKSHWDFGNEREDWILPYVTFENRIGIHVQENKTDRDRWGMINILTPGREGAKNAAMFTGSILVIQKSADDYFSLSTYSLSFPKEGGSQTINVTHKSDDVDLWFAWGQPDWCKITKDHEHDCFTVSVDEFREGRNESFTFYVSATSKSRPNSHRNYQVSVSVFLEKGGKEEDIRAALEEFYYDTGGDNWKRNDNWCSDKPISEWYGIDRIEGEGNLYGIQLDDNNLHGEAKLADCSFLRYISVNDNDFLWSLDVSRCRELKLIYYNDHIFHDLIASGCTSLEVLDFERGNLDVGGCSLLKKINCTWTESLNVLGCTSLESLTVWNGSLDALDVSNCSSLKELYCSDNQLSSLNLSGCSSLEYLSCRDNRLETLDLSRLVSLEYVYCDSNPLRSLNASGCVALKGIDWWGYDGHCVDYVTLSGCLFEELVIPGKAVKSLNVSGCTSLKRLRIEGGALDTNWGELRVLNISGCSSLEWLSCHNNQLTSLDVTGCCSSLKELYCNDNQLTSLNVTGCSSLKFLGCSNNQFTSLDVSGCSSLYGLYCRNNQLTSLDVSGCSALNELYCDSESLFDYIDCSGCTSLSDFNYYAKHLKLSGCASIEELPNFTWDCGLVSLDVSGCSSLHYLRCSSNQLTSLNVSGCSSLKELDCYNSQLTALDVSDCSSLSSLRCGDNQFTSLDISGHPSLFYISCEGNKFTSLNASGCPSLHELSCSGNDQLSSLEVSNCSSLERLVCYNNQLTSLDVSYCSSLETLFCEYNQLISLDVSTCSSLKTLNCNNNHISSLDVSKCLSLRYLDSENNQLTSLNVSGCSSLYNLHCRNNKLTSLDVSGCSSLSSLWCQNNHIIQQIRNEDSLWGFGHDVLYDYSKAYWDYLTQSWKGVKKNAYGWYYPGEPNTGGHHR